jgi:hypothetical protein
MKHLLISVQKPGGFFTTGFVVEEAEGIVGEETEGFVTGGVTTGALGIVGLTVRLFNTILSKQVSGFFRIV